VSQGLWIGLEGGVRTLGGMKRDASGKSPASLRGGRGGGSGEDATGGGRIDQVGG